MQKIQDIALIIWINALKLCNLRVTLLICRVLSKSLYSADRTRNLSGLVVIDQIQGASEVFSVLINRDNHNLENLIRGSAPHNLINQSSETLARRIGYLE